MMNKSKLKTFAIAARIDLLCRVSDRAAFYGLTKTSWEKKTYAASDIYQKPDGSLLTRAEIAQRERLIQRLSERGFDYVIEEAAYTWFNRLIAIRYMQQHMLLPLAMRVLPQAPGQLPQIIEEAHLVELPGLDVGRVLSLIEASRTEALYKYLIITLCNALNASLPQMFETISDYTELLFPDNLLRAESALGLLSELEDDNWQEIQVIGWLYQYYNTELKDETFELLKKNVKISKDRIGAATQLFTPEWIVRYMVQNSLGRLWLEGHPSPSLRARWRYYLDEAAQEPEVEAQLQVLRAQRTALRPEDIRLIDPCMGSGHILVYAFDLLMDIYRSVGYTDRDAVESILTHNLYGLDIDDRAAQLAYFALMMKACEYDKRFLKRSIQPRVCAIQESNSLAAFEGLRGQLRLDTLCLRTANELIDTFKDAKIYGSLIPVTIEGPGHVDSLITQLEEAATKSLEVTAWLEKVKNRLRQLAQQAAIMQTRYDVVITNPPYMGSSGMDAKLSQFVNDQYPDSKSDLFSAFIERGLHWITPTGYNCMVTMQSWMFLSSFETMRKKILSTRTITNLLHMENMVMGIAFGTAVANYFGQHIADYKGQYNYMTIKDIDDDKPTVFPTTHKRNCSASAENFEKIPGCPVAYWVKTSLINAFENNKINDISISDGQTKTGNNDKYLRLIWEVSNRDVGKNVKWAIHLKGGAYRRWYGNIDTVIDWSVKAREHYRKDHVARIAPEYIWFRKGISWTLISSINKLAVRLLEENATFNLAAPSIFIKDIALTEYVLGFLNTPIAENIRDLMNPTLNTNISDITSMPILIERVDEVTIIVNDNITLARADWDAVETSFDFKRHPLICGEQKVAASFTKWKCEAAQRFDTLKANEEELNRIFIDIYGLQGELSPDVADRDVTVYRIIDEPDTEERKMPYVLSMKDEITSLLSYMVGCMLGRYSPYVDGLLYAGGEWDYEAIHARIEEAAPKREFYDKSLGLFLPDPDGIIPITDDAYFADDILTRTVEFTRKVYGAETLEENLAFIAGALKGKGDTPREVIRNYYLNDFYADHLRTYKKRPIYWLCDSGKQAGFRALFYLHRYTPDTAARLRTDYVHELQDRLRVQLEESQRAAESAGGSLRAAAARRAQKLDKQLSEVNRYEEIVHHIADMRIPLDLDDGVKVNYAKLQDILGKI